MSKGERCEICRFSRDGKEGKQGFCHRFPPQVTQEVYSQIGSSSVSSDRQTNWPVIAPDDWCGEFKPVNA